MSVNNDVLALIVDHIGDRTTLHALLTVSRDTFRLACAALYRDPLQYLLHGTRKSLKKNRVAFIRLVLALSPARDDDTNLLRSVFDAQAGEHPASPSTTPMLDYLSLIRVVRWEESIQPSLASPKRKRLLPGHGTDERQRKAFIRSTLTWCIVGHQLHNIRELELEPRSIDRYVDMAQHLSRVHKIVIRVDRDDDNVADVYPPTIRLVEAIKKHHGNDLLRECRLSESPLELYNQTNDLYHHAMGLSRLLPPISIDGRAMDPPGPLDADLLRLTTINTSLSPWPAIVQLYSGFSAGQILERCRALTNIIVDIDVDTLTEIDMFEWAVAEARQRAAAAVSQSSNNRVFPAIPLTQLSLRARDLQANNHENAKKFKRMLEDSLNGFADTLQWVYFDLDSTQGEDDVNGVGLAATTNLTSSFTDGADNNDDNVDGAFGILNDIRTMPHLKHLEFRSTGPALFDLRLLQSCPNLSSLAVALFDSHIPWSTLPPTSIACWPVLHSSSLTSLELGGRAIHLFDPTSLQHMPQLEELGLMQIEEDRTPGAPRFMDRWTWDWYMPRLKGIHLWSTSVKNCFSLKFLRTCPNLQTLELECNSVIRCRLDVRSVLDDPERDVYPMLRTLHLWEYWDIGAEDLAYLMQQVLPGLRYLELGNPPSCTGEQALEAVRHHASLRTLDAPGELLDEEGRARLGLVRESEVPLDIYAQGRRHACVYDFDGVRFRYAV